jgi:hypothetical protein
VEELRKPLKTSSVCRDVWSAVIVYDELETVWKEAVAYLSQYLSTWVSVLRKTSKALSHDSQPELRLVFREVLNRKHELYPLDIDLYKSRSNFYERCLIVR